MVKHSVNDAMNIHIRPARPEDLPTLKQFEQGIVAAERPYDQTLKPDPISYYDLGALIDMEDTEAMVVVAEQNGAVIGSGFARRKQSKDYVRSDTHAELGFMYVDPAHRGKGVNQLVVGALIAWADENKLSEIHLEVYPANDAAIRAYEKAGFRPYMLEMRLGRDA